MAGSVWRKFACTVNSLWLSGAIRWRAVSFGLTILLLVVLGSGSCQPRAYIQLSNAIDDSRWRFQQSSGAIDNPVLIDIDDDSLRFVGPWPWPRELVAHLIELLRAAGAKVIALDIVFPEPKDPVGDRELQRYLAMPGVVTGMHPSLGHAASLLPVACPGHIVPYPDVDGVVRRLAPWIDNLPALSLAVLSCHPDYSKHAELLSTRWRTELAQEPAFAEGSVVVPWRYGSHQFQAISAYRVLSASAPAEVRGRVVIIGSSAVGLSDRIASPLQSPVAGMQVHASIIAQTLSANRLPPRDWRWLPWVWSSLGSVALACLLYWHKPWAALALWLALAAGWVAILRLLPVTQAMQPALPVVILASWLVLQIPAEWLAAQAQVNRLGQRMKRYLPPAVFSEILRMQRSGIDPTAPRRRRITVLFADVVGYTALAEQLNPERLALLTQQLLEVMTQSVLDQQGTLDKYMGDAIMAFWGAPLDQPQQADLACAAAVTLQQDLAKWNESYRKRHFADIEPVAVTIGIHTGEAVVGELGSSQRQTYTAIGDTVNIAQRLQALAAEQPGLALLSCDCVKASAYISTMVVGSHNLRGRKDPLMVYQLLSARL